MKKTMLIASAIIVVLSSAAWSPQDELQQNRKVPEFEKQVRVNRVLIDIIVLDATGNYVHGLTAGDFELYENGAPVEIKTVDEYFLEGMEPESTEIAATRYDSPPRNVIIILDKLFSSTRALMRGKEALLDFIRTKLQPGDRAMIFTYNRTFQVVQDLTTDHRQLEMAATGISTLTASDDTPEMTMNLGTDADAEFRLATTDITNASRYSQFVDPVKNIRMQNEIRTFLEKLQLLAKSLKSLPGRKTVILLSEGYDERLIQNPVITTYRSPDFRLAEAEATRTDESVTSDPSGRFQTSSLLSIYNDMTKWVNDASTSFYVVDLASMGGQVTRADQHYQQTAMARVDYMSSRIDSLAALADSTGGKLYSGTENLGQVLDEINSDISNYYIISYATPNPSQEGRFRKVKVETKDRSLSVRTREGYHESKRFEKLDKKERFVHLMEPFFKANAKSEMEAKSTIFFLPLYPNMVAAALAVEIPAEQLGGAGDQSLELVGTVTDKSDTRVDAFHKLIQYKDYLSQIRSEGYFTLKVPMVLSNGINRINVVIRDNSTGKRHLIFGEYMAHGTPPDDLYISSIAMFDEEDHISTVEKHSMQMEDLGEKTGYRGHRIPDPLRAAVGKPIFPRMNTRFCVDEQPIVFFCAGNFWIDPKTNAVDFFIDYTVIDAEGNETIIPVGKEKMFPIPGTGRVNIMSQLVFSGLQPGQYQLRVRFLDHKKLQGVQRELPITIE
jgi:VWFA-related protein